MENEYRSSPIFRAGAKSIRPKFSTTAKLYFFAYKLPLQFYAWFYRPGFGRKQNILPFSRRSYQNRACRNRVDDVKTTTITTTRMKKRWPFDWLLHSISHQINQQTQFETQQPTGMTATCVLSTLWRSEWRKNEENWNLTHHWCRFDWKWRRRQRIQGIITIVVRLSIVYLSIRQHLRIEFFRRPEVGDWIHFLVDFVVEFVSLVFGR